MMIRTHLGFSLVYTSIWMDHVFATFYPHNQYEKCYCPVGESGYPGYSASDVNVQNCHCSIGAPGPQGPNGIQGPPGIPGECISLPQAVDKGPSTTSFNNGTSRSDFLKTSGNMEYKLLIGIIVVFGGLLVATDIILICTIMSLRKVWNVIKTDKEYDRLQRTVAPAPVEQSYRELQALQTTLSNNTYHSYMSVLPNSTRNSTIHNS